MRTLLIGIGLCLVATPAAGQQFASPADLVETLYNSYFSGLAIDDFGPYLSEDLTRQMAGKVGVAQFAALGFDPIVGDADWNPRRFRIVPIEEGPDSARISVRFDNDQHPVSVTLTLVAEPAHGWQIDHIVGVAGDRTWCTNDILALSPLDDGTDR